MFAFPKKEHNTFSEHVGTTLPKKNTGNALETYAMKSRPKTLLKLDIKAQRFYCGKFAPRYSVKRVEVKNNKLPATRYGSTTMTYWFGNSATTQELNSKNGTIHRHSLS